MTRHKAQFYMSINKQLKLWVRANTMDQMVCTVRHVVVHKARYVDDIVVMTPTGSSDFFQWEFIKKISDYVEEVNK